MGSQLNANKWQSTALYELLIAINGHGIAVHENLLTFTSKLMAINGHECLLMATNGRSIGSNGQITVIDGIRVGLHTAVYRLPSVTQPFGFGVLVL